MELKDLLASKKAETEEREQRYKTMPLTEAEKTHWTDYILTHSDNLYFGVTIEESFDLFKKDLMFDGRKISEYRRCALAKWLKSQGLYLHIGFNSYLSIYSKEGIDAWEKDAPHCYFYFKNGFVECLHTKTTTDEAFKMLFPTDNK